MIRVELENPSLAAGIFPGLVVAIGERENKFQRIVNWFKRVVLRMELPKTYVTVASVDYQRGIIDLAEDDDE